MGYRPVAVLLSILLLGSLGASEARADPLQIDKLEVAGGEGSWHATNDFDLNWFGARGTATAPVVASHYRIRTQSGVILVGDTRLDGRASWIDDLQVPNGPGEYIADVWVEDSAGNLGPVAQAMLRFDDVRPQSAVPLSDSGWINRTEIPFALRIGHPSNPLPVSGIRGYAVSLDRRPIAEPCESTDRCTDAETDLHGGIGDDSFPVFDLPEGTSYAHAVAVSNSGMRSMQTSHATLRVDKADPVTTLSGARSDWTDQPLVLTATATDALSGMQPTGGADPFTAIRVDDSPPIISIGGSVTTAVTDEGVHTVAYYARDLAGNVNDGVAIDRPPSTAIIRIDRSAPTVAFTNLQDPDDPELIVAHVSDPLSGPSNAQGHIEIRKVDSGRRFELLPTEVKAGGTLRAHWGSESSPLGEYELRAIGFDAAGNSSTTALRANGTKMALANPLKTPTELHAGLGGEVHLRQSLEKRVAYGRDVLYDGRLSTTHGAPLADMPVRVIERFPPGADRPERLTTVRTDGDGAFAVDLLPGPSRQVTAAFQGTKTLTGSGAEIAELKVRSAVRMHASSAVAKVGGRAIVFSGQVAASGATIPSRGRSVQLQFHLAGVPWTEFRTVQTDPRGRFRYAYRFTDNDSRGISFQFRAFVPAQNDWPYEPAPSRPVVVRGR